MGVVLEGGAPDRGERALRVEGPHGQGQGSRCQETGRHRDHGVGAQGQLQDVPAGGGGQFKVRELVPASSSS